MNKTTIYVLLLVLLGGVAAWYLMSGKSNTFGSSESDFEIKEIESVHKIFIGNRDGETATLEKQADGAWQVNGKYKARQQAIDLLLETANKINILYILPEAAKPGVYKELSSRGILARFYDKNGKKIKAYQIGDVAADNQGTHAMMEGSEQPYVVHIPIWEGHLTPRYMIAEPDWRDRAIFEIPYDEIQSVEIEYPNQKGNSFKLTKTGNNVYDVVPYFATTPKINKPTNQGQVQNYLKSFKRIDAEAFRNEVPKEGITELMPFSVVTVTKTDGTVKKVSFFPIPSQGATTANISPLMPNGIPERYYAIVGNELYLVQHIAFMRIFMGYPGFF